MRTCVRTKLKSCRSSHCLSASTFVGPKINLQWCVCPYGVILRCITGELLLCKTSIYLHPTTESLRVSTNNDNYTSASRAARDLADETYPLV